MNLPTKITIALVLGVVAGTVTNVFGIGWLGDGLEFLEQFGQAWIDLITMVVIPLVFASLVVGVNSLGDMTRLGRIGGKTVAFYLCTTAIAVSIGLLVSNLIAPGSRIDQASLDNLRSQYGAQAGETVEMAGEGTPGLLDVLFNMIPRNPVESLANMDMLAIIFFAIFFGAALAALPSDRRGGVVDFFDGVNEAAMKMVHWVMELAPYAVFALIAPVISRFGMEVLQSLLVYTLVVLGGLLLHASFTYPAALRFIAGVSPVDFLRRIREVPLIAFSTSSSNATLPVTMETAERDLGVSNGVASFVLPLGATINMDGTALYQAVATMFIAQVLVGDISLAAQFGIVLTATLASIGAAGVPSAGIIILIVVLQQALPAGVDPAAGIALILGVDRILDMCRTAVNVTGDLTAATVVARSEGETLTIRTPGAGRPAAAGVPDSEG
jgi:Na+/H+-dicarboxylate symporter